MEIGIPLPPLPQASCSMEMSAGFCADVIAVRLLDTGAWSTVDCSHRKTECGPAQRAGQRSLSGDSA
jgi:hypothetical protein